MNFWIVCLLLAFGFMVGFYFGAYGAVKVAQKEKEEEKRKKEEDTKQFWAMVAGAVQKESAESIEMPQRPLRPSTDDPFEQLKEEYRKRGQ